MTSHTTDLEALLDSDVLEGLLLDTDRLQYRLSQLRSRETTPDMRGDQTKPPSPPEARLPHP